MMIRLHTVSLQPNRPCASHNDKSQKNERIKMRSNLSTFSLTLAGCLLVTAAVASPETDQRSYDQLVIAAGASNGAAETCGASQQDLTQARATAHRNLIAYASEFHYDASHYESLYSDGAKQGETMMQDMKRNGTDGCAGVLQSLQSERNISYSAMKSSIAEVTDGLPDEKAEK